MIMSEAVEEQERVFQRVLYLLVVCHHQYWSLSVSMLYGKREQRRREGVSVGRCKGALLGDERRG